MVIIDWRLNPIKKIQKKFYSGVDLKWATMIPSLSALKTEHVRFMWFV